MSFIKKLRKSNKIKTNLNSKILKSRKLKSFKKLKSNPKLNTINIFTFKYKIKKDKISFDFYNNGYKMTLQEGLFLLTSKTNDFRDLCSEILKKVPFKAYLFKLTPIEHKEDIGNPHKYFKITVKDDPFLYNRQEDPVKYNKYLTEKCINDYFCIITSLSGNKLMIPKQLTTSDNTYVHLANFIRNAPYDQLQMFWYTLASYILDSNFEKLYLNTHGHDVPWLHLRFDTKETNW